MGRSPCCDKANVKKGPWSPEEDAKLKEFIEKFGTGGNWIALPQKAGLRRCGKSCRLRWLNYLRPNIKHGEFSDEENSIICTLYASIGSRWSIIAAQLPGRTDNNIKNHWNTKLKKKLMRMVIPSHQENFSQSFPGTLQTESQPLSSLSQSYGDYNSFYGHASNSLTPSESISAPQNLPHHGSESFSLSTNQYSYYHQDQEGLVDLQCCPWTDYNNNMLMFGGNEASCSSSDGNYSQTSNGKDNLKQEEMGCLQDLVSNGTEEDQNSMILYGKFLGDNPVDPFLDQKPFGIFERGLLQSDAEEVKRLTGSCNGGNSNNNYDLFFNNENPTDVLREMFYR